MCIFPAHVQCQAGEITHQLMMKPHTIWCIRVTGYDPIVINCKKDTSSLCKQIQNKYDYLSSVNMSFSRTQSVSFRDGTIILLYMELEQTLQGNPNNQVVLINKDTQILIINTYTFAMSTCYQSDIPNAGSLFSYFPLFYFQCSSEKSVTLFLLMQARALDVYGLTT